MAKLVIELAWLAYVKRLIAGRWLDRLFISKVWFDRVWLMYGWQSQVTGRFERAWLKSLLPPYYEGVGLSIRIKRHAIRIGVCRMLGSHEDWYAEPGDLAIEAAHAGARLMSYPTGKATTWASSEATATIPIPG